MELKDFCENDWLGFAGCSYWPDGELPLIGNGRLENGKEYVIVFDPTGACLLVENDDEVNDYGGRTLSMNIPSQQLAYAIARGMGEPETIHQFHTFVFREA